MSRGKRNQAHLQQIKTETNEVTNQQSCSAVHYDMCRKRVHYCLTGLADSACPSDVNRDSFMLG